MDIPMSAPAARKRWDIKAFLHEHGGALSLIACAFAADRLSKFWAVRSLAGTPGLPLLPFFHFSYVENTGTAFGLLSGANAFFIVFTVAVLAFLGWNWRQFVAQAGGSAAPALIAAGALGNLYDRIFLGKVIDFLDFRVWPVFNIADSCICIGAALLALKLLRREEPAAKETNR